MGKGRIFIGALCASLLYGPRAADTGDRVAGGWQMTASVAASAYAERVDGPLGVWTSFDEAMDWLYARARAGDPASRYELAHLKFTGVLDQDAPGETVSLLTAAAEAGHAQAQLLLGRLHEFGLEGLQWDAVQALKWYERAAGAGTSMDLRAAAAEAVQRLRARLSPRQIAAAETSARLTWAAELTISPATAVE